MKLSRLTQSNGYQTQDWRYTVVPYFSPSIRGGSVTRPSGWQIIDHRGHYPTRDVRTLREARELIAGRSR